MRRGFVRALDVALHAGVSRSAVSRCFTPGASVSDAVRLRVEASARALGYRVNRLAQTLHTERSSLVGVVGSNLANPYLAVQLADLTAALVEEDLQCLLMNASGDGKDLRRSLQLLLEYRVRAVVVLSGAPHHSLVRECLDNGVRVVLINRTVDSALADIIAFDAEQGGRLAAERLIADGRRRVAVVQSASKTLSKRQRAEAFRARMAEAGVEVVTWTRGGNSYAAGEEAARALLGQGGIDGVFCVTDELGLGFLNAARHALARRIPEEMSLIAFDDVPQAAWSSHAMTTIRQPVAELNRAVIEALTRDTAGDRRPFVRKIPVTLVERGTTLPGR
ncbi:LacI family DNA-binding transcriptional regulator [Nitratireductor sp. GCM10026969]|uniref:LacI family DNA-binding transcriptional regulator n=1 Tax=Nitratireductor sp. GCM10026969 TaxID=3252645 RepID=UPI00361FD0CD